MISKPIKLILFLSSYSPLFLIMMVKNSFSSRLVNILLGVTIVVSLITLYYFIESHKDIEPDFIKIKNVNLRDSEATSYIVSYILPFLTIDLTKASDKYSLLILFIVVAVIYINTHMIYINPILNLIGYHLFQVQDSEGNSLIIITQDSFITSNNTIKVISISGHVYLKEGEDA